MTSIQYLLRLRETLKRKRIRPLTFDQIAEIEEIIAAAMQDAWEYGQEYDPGVPFSNQRM